MGKKDDIIVKLSDSRKGREMRGISLSEWLWIAFLVTCIAVVAIVRLPFELLAEAIKALSKSRYEL